MLNPLYLEMGSLKIEFMLNKITFVLDQIRMVFLYKGALDVFFLIYPIYFSYIRHVIYYVSPIYDL